MKKEHKLENEKFFKAIIRHTKDGGNYIWPDQREIYIIKDGKMIGSKFAIEKLKNITTEDFHNFLVVSN